MCAAVTAPPAAATYKGTPGKVAYLDIFSLALPLKVWDPVEETSVTFEAETMAFGNQGTVTDLEGNEFGSEADYIASAPSWSPDGSEFAYTKMVDDPGLFAGLKQGAIFVHTLKTGVTRQVTTPEASDYDLNPSDGTTFATSSRTAPRPGARTAPRSPSSATSRSSGRTTS